MIEKVTLQLKKHLRLVIVGTLLLAGCLAPLHTPASAGVNPPPNLDCAPIEPPFECPPTATPTATPETGG